MSSTSVIIMPTPMAMTRSNTTVKRKVTTSTATSLLDAVRTWCTTVRQPDML
ncbi:Uncharacterised protein [Collinsella intestinalis]|nr:Uncharacterised protein [Collinsella intestinalis]